MLNAVIAKVLFSTCCYVSKWFLFWYVTCSDCKSNIFSNVGTFCDESKWILFWTDKCNDYMSTNFCMLGHSVLNQNKFCFEVLNAVIARVLYSHMLGHSLVHQNDWSNKCSYCKSTVFYMLGHSVMHAWLITECPNMQNTVLLQLLHLLLQNKISFD